MIRTKQLRSIVVRILVRFLVAGEDPFAMNNSHDLSEAVFTSVGSNGKIVDCHRTRGQNIRDFLPDSCKKTLGVGVSLSNL